MENFVTRDPFHIGRSLQVFLDLVSALVDRPTQLICIWVSICCQQTNRKDIAGNLLVAASLGSVTVSIISISSIEAEVVSPVKWCGVVHRGGVSDTDRDTTFASPRGRVASHSRHCPSSFQSLSTHTPS